MYLFSLFPAIPYVRITFATDLRTANIRAARRSFPPSEAQKSANLRTLANVMRTLDANVAERFGIRKAPWTSRGPVAHLDLFPITDGEGCCPFHLQRDFPSWTASRPDLYA